MNYLKESPIQRASNLFQGQALLTFAQIYRRYYIELDWKDEEEVFIKAVKDTRLQYPESSYHGNKGDEG